MQEPSTGLPLRHLCRNFQQSTAEMFHAGVDWRFPGLSWTHELDPLAHWFYDHKCEFLSTAVSSAAEQCDLLVVGSDFPQQHTAFLLTSTFTS